jgi:L-threonylcarbamoyladenylate synthase
VIVHLADAGDVDGWAREVPATARRLAERFWPGPLTLILRRAAGVHDVVTGGQDTVGLRVPSHPVARRLLARFGGGIAAPSANRFGRVSATTAEHVRREFGAEVPCVLDGGQTPVGIESTIVDLSGRVPVLLRPGWIGAWALEAALGTPVRAPGAGAPRAPGTLARHYAPRTPLALVEAGRVGKAASALLARGKRVAVLALGATAALPPGVRAVEAPRDPAAYAHALYATLRALDEAGCDAILVERPPLDGAWAAIHDRLARAAAGAEGEGTT